MVITDKVSLSYIEGVGEGMLVPCERGVKGVCVFNCGHRS